MVAFCTVLCFANGSLSAQTGKDPKKKPAVAGPEKRVAGKTDPKATDKAKTDDKKTQKAPETLEELREYALAKLDATMKAANAKLKTDVEALEAKAEITPAMVTELKTALVAALKGALKPSETSASKLASDLATFAADGKVAGENLLKIQGDVQAVLFSPAVTDKQIEELKTSLQAIAKSANLGAGDTTTLVNGAEAVAKNATKDGGAGDPKKAGTPPAKPATGTPKGGR